MGLDMVELVMRCEEFFHIEIADEKAGRIQTVGDLYYTVVGELHLERPAAIPLDGEPNPLMVERHPWTQENVWPTIVAIVVDQLQVNEDEVKPHASFSNDLGCD